MRSYNAMHVARYIIDKCSRERNPISNLQLQKILFFIQREYLQRFRMPSFNGVIEAWKFGPVVPNVYYQFSGYGASPITLTYNNLDPIDDDDQENMDPVIESLRRMDPWDLVNETHKSGGSWENIFQKGQGNKKIIPPELIRELG